MLDVQLFSVLIWWKTLRQTDVVIVKHGITTVLARPPKSLEGIALHVRILKALRNQDQSRPPCRKRKLEVFSQILPISAPFHGTHSVIATNRILERLGKSRVSVAHSNWTQGNRFATLS